MFETDQCDDCRLCKSERRALAANVKLADMIFAPNTCERRYGQAVSLSGGFLAHG